MGSKSSSAPAPDPRLISAQINSMGVQDAAIQQVLKNSAELAPLQRQQLQFGLDSAKTAYTQSQADRDWMLSRRGQLSNVQDRLVKDAEEFNSEDRLNQMLGTADADVDSAFSGARGQMARGLARTGVTPGSGRSLAMNNQLTMAQAASKVAAANKVRTAARAEGMALTDRAHNALAGYPAMGMSATGAGAGYGSAGLGLANAGLAGMNSGFGQAGSMAGGLGSNAAGMYGAMGSYKNGQDQIAASSDPFNTLLGAVSGAGTSWALGKWG